MKNKKSVHTNYPPLLCWDIFMEGCSKRIHLAEDLKILQKIMSKNNWSTLPISLDNVLVWQNKVIVITDASVIIVHATKNIFAMNGYQPDEVIGRSAKLFQGEATTADERKIIKMAIENQKPFDTIITNYKKDGTLYKCHIEGYPVFNNDGVLVNFIALESAA